MAPDGYTYELAYIKQWIARQDNQASTPENTKMWPSSQMEMTSTSLIPNHTLRGAIHESLEKTLKAIFARERGDIQLQVPMNSRNSLVNMHASAEKESVETRPWDIPLAASAIVAATVDRVGTHMAEENDETVEAEKDQGTVAAAKVSAAADKVVVEHGVAEEVYEHTHTYIYSHIKVYIHMYTYVYI